MKLFSTLLTTSLTAAAIAFGGQKLTSLVAFVALAFVQLPHARAYALSEQQIVENIITRSTGNAQNTEGLVIPNGMNVVLGAGTAITVPANVSDTPPYCNKTALDVGVYNVGSTDGPKLTISGGEYTSCGYGVATNVPSATVTMCDGTFRGGRDGGAASIYGGVFHMAGGTLIGEGEESDALDALAPVQITITGGTLTASDGALLLIVENNYTVDIWGGRFQGPEGIWDFYSPEGSLTVHGKKDLKLVGTNLVGTLCDGSFLNVSISGNLPSELNIIRNCAGFPKFPECGACGGKSGKGNLFRP
jgi:hypothetical protein